MKLKKILAAVSAVVVMSAGSVNNVSASAPASYDVNGDGMVDISDAVAISTALAGQWQPINLSTLDANQNGIIDDLDRMAIMSYVSMYGIPTITMQ